MGSIKPKKRVCKSCPRLTFGRECSYCKSKRYAAKSKEKAKDKPKKQPVRNYRKTGMLEYFKEIWGERPHISEVSQEPIHHFDIRCFSHILPRSTYPLFATYKKNLVLKTPKEHDLWQFHQDEIKDDPMWKPFFQLKEELTREYYQKFYGKKFDEKD